jgi:hypothetical protein
MEDPVPSLPVYEKPRQQVPAVIPKSLPTTPPKPPSSLNKLLGKMLKPNLKRAFKMPNRKHKKQARFY